MVGGGLNIVVKSEKKSGSSGEAETEYKVRIEHGPGSGGAGGKKYKKLRKIRNMYKVRIEHSPGAGGAGGKRRKNELSLDWTFTCSCGLPSLGLHHSAYNSGLPPRSPICKHIGACLIVHFH